VVPLHAQKPSREERYVERVDVVTIRPATQSDVPALSDLAKRTWSKAFGGSTSAADEAAELEQTRCEAYFRNALQERTVLVAEGDRGLVGYVQFGVRSG
jgi:hypothetical protein